jgi:hypothetical protein
MAPARQGANGRRSSLPVYTRRSGHVTGVAEVGHTDDGELRMDAQPLGGRLWRIRWRGQWIDATLGPLDDRWRLTLTRKGRVLAALEFEKRAEALQAAAERRRDFERAGWTEHW